ncbi:enoyl-CoA hydratase/isomerase family protein [Quisquiliibacterium transsilvanicum]|uniref:2-(1,2-epoxy-1,2-dihydrophenyl)acetyl-CoA isomerase n=1 Tax=Quisquiliibacterium transsilvanicum TaxID=1549638 RepID=A0A7W8HM36_9BURK|nr:enoyl-CoA hydratase-related protein [Quisquiliibacterium transsilvanicum]MBB5273585.1 2-(1,2-epoxy-1,2-dihydrophenyl)acetyl-CoA isomerase [Quisquiliibacterium transsilvanicum]
MSAESPVLWSVENGVGRITLNRPERANAVGLESSRALAAAIDAVVAAAPRVVVLTGRGRLFCAGGDIGEFVADQENMAGLIDDILAPLHPALLRLATMPAPVITAVNGPLGGAGIALALCGDIVLAADTMKLRAGYSAIGLTPDAGASWFLSRRVGASKAKELFLLNDSMSADECLRLGIVNAVCPAAELEQRTQALVDRLLAGAAGAFARIKILCDGAEHRDLADHLALEHQMMLASAASADAREGVRAFSEKRAPKFGG